MSVSDIIIDKLWEIAKDLIKDFSIKIKTRATLEKAYTKYLTNIRKKYSKSKSFFIRDKPVDLYDYYVPIGIECWGELIKSPTFDNCCESSNRIVIMGTGGSGKTVLMKHLFLDCIEDKRYIPIFIEFRDINNQKQSLDEAVISTLSMYGLEVPESFVKKAKQAGQFCFFLDGYDEANHSLKKNLIKQIKDISSRFSGCPIFISSRPDNVSIGLEEFSIFYISPLELDSAKALIEKLPADEQIKQKFITDLSDGLFEHHQSFLSNPLLLSIMLLTYGENAQIPSKLSIFYNQAYEALFHRHDAHKAGFKRKRKTDLDIKDFSDVFSSFSLQTYDKHLFKMNKSDCLDFIKKSRNYLYKDIAFEAENYLDDLLSATCLLLEDGLEIAFSHRSFQEYFVALYIASVPPKIQEKLINKYLRYIMYDNVIFLLLEINPELVERLLFIPKLEKLFKDIGVKKKVGVTHATKYIKNMFDELIVFEDNIIYVKYKSLLASSVGGMMFLFVKYYAVYSYPNIYEHEKQKKLPGRGIGKKYPTKSLSYKTPILADILNGEEDVSIKYLQAVYDKYKMIREKNANSSRNLDDLLGIEK